MTPAALLRAAREMMERPDPALDGLWPRACALLLRQALEAAVDELIRDQVRDLDKLNTSVRLLCLLDVVERSLARRAAYAWSAISGACHHHGYELPPTVGELRSWAAVVDEVIAASST